MSIIVRRLKFFHPFIAKLEITDEGGYKLSAGMLEICLSEAQFKTWLETGWFPDYDEWAEIPDLVTIADVDWCAVN